MATTSTNKQPLLVDRLLHYVVDTTKAINGKDNIRPSSSNSAILLVDATTSDGAILEDVYAIGIGAGDGRINLYVSPARDYLRLNEGMYVGSVDNPSKGEVKHWDDMPRTLTPVPQQGNNPYNQAFYLPKGLALWAARESDNDSLTDAPILGCQGGWY